MLHAEKLVRGAACSKRLFGAVVVGARSLPPLLAQRLCLSCGPVVSVSIVSSFAVDLLSFVTRCSANLRVCSKLLTLCFRKSVWNLSSLALI